MNLLVYRDQISQLIGASGAQFDNAVIDAINSVISDINTYCFQNLDFVDDFEEDYPLDEKKYGRAMRDGISYYVQHYGTWVREPNIPVAYQRYMQSLALAQYHAITDLDPDSGTPEGEWADAESEDE